MTTDVTSPRAVAACPSCHTLNRVVLDRLDDGPRCAECAQPLRLDRPVQAGDAHLSRVISGSTVPVLVDFHADWCGPCRQMAPVLEDVAKELAGELLVVKVNSDQNPVSPQHFGVRGIPTLIVFRDGQEVARQVGAVPKARLLELIRTS